MENTLPLSQVLQHAFPGLNNEEAEDMIGSGKIATYPPDLILCHEGALETIFYIILDGEVRVTKVINDSDVRFLKALKPGDFFGEMAIIHNAPRAATITTTTQTTVLEINKESFNRMLENNSSISMAMVREVSRRLRENDEMAIEDLRMKAKELADAYQRLTELEHARNQFLSTIAHELRTPLMAANGFIQVIQMGVLNGEALDSAFNSVARNLQDITILTNDILFLQEMDLILPKFQPVDLGSLVAAAVEKQRKHAEQNAVRIKLVIPSGIPAIEGDAKSLERAITAVLDNAIKFSPDGGDVLVEINMIAGYVRIIIQDQGVGITAEALPNIYDRFFHMDKIGVHLFRGIGLGLSIARQVIEQHRGEIQVQSEPGCGSIFTLSLPVSNKPSAL
ncbi:MAG: ATP-binding protein [Anaerolineaceae bacterium]|nr:ATP-binding protein [Anaerolineaceae bacterium]